MDIILVSGHMATARTVTVTARHVVAVVFALLGTIALASVSVSFLALKHLPEFRLPFAQRLVVELRAEETRKAQAFLRENLDAMAVRLGRMQAQLRQLDFLGERVSALAGVEVAAPLPAAPGRGGPLIPSTGAPPGAQELASRIEALSGELASRADALGAIEARLLDEGARRELLPARLPVDAAWDSSSYGWRNDPITGERALHTGIDFNVAQGTPIVAAAGGVVVAAERHAQYGNYVDIDHGNDLVTRYAHASRLLVRPGTIVRPGEKIAEVGSTGRSTGPHLHFEVRLRDVPQDPRRYLEAARARSLAAR